MTLDPEVSEEVVGIGEKCSSGLISCNGKGTDQGGDPDNSYVFVTGSDGLSDDSGDCKEDDVAVVAAEGQVVGDVEVQDSKLNVLNGDVSDSETEVNVGGVEGNRVSSVANIGGVEGNGVGSVANGIGIGEVAVVVDVSKDQNGRAESDVEPEIKIADEDSNGRVAGVDSENVVDHEQVEDTNGRLGSLLEVEVDVVTDQNGMLENVEVNEGKLIEDPDDEMLRNSERAEMKEAGHQNESLQDESNCEIKQVKDPSEPLESLEGSESEVVADPILYVDEDEIKQAGDPEKRLESLEGSKSELVADPKVNVVDDEIKEVEDPDKKPESSVGAEMETIVDQTEIIECAAETEVKNVGDLNLQPKSSAGVETEMVPEQRTEGVAESESPEVVKQIMSEASRAAIVDLESQVGNGGLVAVPEDNCELNHSSLVVNGYCDENDASNDRSDLESTRRSEICQGSEVVVEDPVETQLQEVDSERKKEILLAKDLVETGLGEVPAETSMATDIESHLANNNDGTLEEQANEASISDVMGNKEHKAIPSIQGRVLQVDDAQSVVRVLQVDDAQSVVAGDDRAMETVGEVLETTFEEDKPVSHGELFVQNDKDPEKLSDTCGISSETETEPTALSQSSSAHEPQGEIVMPSDETAGETSLALVDDTQLQIGETDWPTEHESLPVGTKYDDASSEPASMLGLVVPAETEPSSSLNGDANVEAEESIVKHEVFIDQPAAADVKLEGHESGAASYVGKVSEVAAGLDVKDRDSDAVLGTEDVEDVEDQVHSGRSSTDENFLLQENKGLKNSEGASISVASPECSRTDATSGEEIVHPVVTRPFNYVMKVPRFNVDGLKEQINQAKLQVEEKTKLRDAIQRQIQQIRANSQIHGVDYEYAKGENRNARKLVRLKRMEIDSLQSVINKAKNAISIGDIDTRIYNVEHMIQHETLPLKEEKQLIREIKQLRGLRGELSSDMGTEEEIRQALDQKEEAEERLKSLRKELELLKGNVLKTEAAIMEAGTKYDNEFRKVRELQEQFKFANDVRQEAYARCLSLRKDLSEKNKHFFKYRDDASTAGNYAFNRDTESLYHLCTDQVEKVMELWNTNAEFRKEYINFNTRSTVRRFGTLDGRSLGPDEQPIVLPNYVDERVRRPVLTQAKVDLVSQGPLEPSLEESVNNESLADLLSKKTTEYTNIILKSKKAAEPVIANGLEPVNRLDVPDEVQEEPVKSKEEIDLDRKAEELRKKEAEAKLKEQRRLEGLAKANEARERKKRQAEKIQLRAELKAQKEAEEKEKEREKRLRKKERKQAGATDSNDGKTNSDSAPGSESAMEASREVEAKDMAPVVPKKAHKYLKQNKVKSSIPPPLRNRNRKKWQQYAYVTVAGLLVIVLFWVGNANLFSSKTLKRSYPFF